MIPTREEALQLFEKYQLPGKKRVHVEKVTELALFFADQLLRQNIQLNRQLVEVAALLHDIDKNIPKKEGEGHPDTAVRILTELGYQEVAAIVRKHSVHCILDPKVAPKSWEEKLVYLADKMVKQEMIGVDARFDLWFAENLPQEAVYELQQALPYVKALEKEVYEIGKCNFSVLQDFFNQSS